MTTTEQIILTSLFLIIGMYTVLRKVELLAIESALLFFILKASIVWFHLFIIVWIWEN